MDKMKRRGGDSGETLQVALETIEGNNQKKKKQVVHKPQIKPQPKTVQYF